MMMRTMAKQQNINIFQLADDDVDDYINGKTAVLIESCLKTSVARNVDH